MWRSELDNEFLLIEKGSHNTEWEQIGSSTGKKLIWSRDTVMLSDQAWGWRKLDPDGVFSLPFPECTQPATLSPRQQTSGFHDENTQNCREKGLYITQYATFPANSSQFFFPSLQSWVSPPWQYSDVRLDMILFWGACPGLFGSIPWPLSL